MQHQKFMMTVFLSTGKELQVTIVAHENGVTDEDALLGITDKWHHAITCDEQLHLMRFVEWGTNRHLVFMPTEIAGFATSGDTRH